MNLFNKIRFWLVGILVGDCTYIRNATFDWNNKHIIVRAICYWSNTHTNGDPTIIAPSCTQKLSELKAKERM